MRSQLSQTHHDKKHNLVAGGAGAEIRIQLLAGQACGGRRQRPKGPAQWPPLRYGTTSRWPTPNCRLVLCCRDRLRKAERPESDVAHTLRMTEMESIAQEQVLGTRDQSLDLQIIFAHVNSEWGVINASPVASSNTA